MKILFIIFGIISFILGAIGVVLPILPTTPFLLLSAFLFSKSSDRFHEYLIQTKLYQKYINEMVIWDTSQNFRNLKERQPKRKGISHYLQ